MSNAEILSKFPVAEPWSLFTGQAGKGLIFAGLGLFFLAVLLWLFQSRNAKFSRTASGLFYAGCLSILGAMACLVALFVKNQFQFQYVFAHGDQNTELKYKIAGVWTAQQGSFLLWACTSAIFGLLTLRGTGEYRRWYGVTYAAFLASLCGILSYETPFNLLADVQSAGKVFVPTHGAGMTPSLQNYWVVIHPPTIFTGFGSLTVMFAYAVAAMMVGNATDWIRRVRPWTLLSTSVLGLGLSMGGMWAYETQGWGGFWAWDPVENVSFVPWLFTVALLHGIIVQTVKKKWIGSNLILGGMPFITFAYGTLLTRSGLLDKVSVHSFASMDQSALKVLKGFLVVYAVGFAALYLWKGRALAAANKLSAEAEVGGVNREALYRSGVLLISLLSTAIAIGMSWPWLSVLRGGTASAVKEPLYHQVVVWFFIPIMLLMAIAPFVSWRSMGVKSIFNRLLNVLSISIGLLGFAVVWINNPTLGVHLVEGATLNGPFHTRISLLPGMLVLIFLCIFVVVGNVWRISEIYRRARMSMGGFIAHAGLAVLMAGLIISRGFEQKEQSYVREGSPATALGYTIKFDGLTRQSMEDRDGKVRFLVTSPTGDAFVAQPGLYYYPGDKGQPTAMVWPHVEKQASHDIYFSLAPPEIYAWAEPEAFKPGEARTFGEAPDVPITVKFAEMTHEGQFGQPGTKFGAKVSVSYGGNTYSATPKMVMGPNGMDREIPQIGPDYRIAMIGINAADKTAMLQLLFSPPLYPVEFYYKPMTGLVWLGTGILTLGGLMSAFSRRVRTVPLLESDSEIAPKRESEDAEHYAPIPAT